MKKVLLFLTLIILSNYSIFSQSERKGNPSDWKNYVSWAWQGEFDPYLEAYYGIGTPEGKNFNSTFSKIGTAEFRLGYGEFIEYKPNISSIDERFIFAGYGDNELAINNEESFDIDTKMWRFGLGTRLGYGYKFGPFALTPYSQATFVWTKLEFTRGHLSESENNILDLYEDVFRFGHSVEGGVKFELARFISVTASLEGNVVFPRHLFAKWAGSFLIASTVSSLVTVFAEDIVDSSPVLGPIMYFVLKNAVSFGYYYGMKDKMNWPFESEAPLTYEALRISTSVRF